MNWNVKGASEQALDFIDKLKSEKRFSSAQALDYLINMVTSATQQNQGGNPETEQKLQEVTQQLETVTQQLTEKEADIKHLNTCVSDQYEKIVELEANKPEPLHENQFILTIKGKAVPKILEDVRPGFYKKGFTKNTDPDQYRNEIFNYAFRYLAINEFPQHVPA